MLLGIRIVTLLVLGLPGLSHGKCDVVATVFNEEICRSDVVSPDHEQGTSDEQGTSAALDPGDRLRLEKIRLGNAIRSIANEHLLPESSYTPTPEEVDVFEAFSARAAARKQRDDAEIVATAERLLKTYAYDERFRRSLEETITTHKRSIELSRRLAEEDIMRDEDMRARFGEEAVAKLHQRLRKSERDRSRQWVARWKVNKALYDKYGGRVIFQQAGIEPVDAYSDYLNDINSKGELRILEPVYADVFDEFERYLDMGHNYLDESGDRFFARPYWETVDLDAEQRKRIKELQAIPHKKH